MFYGPIHSAEECTTVLYQAVKVHFLKEVTLSLTEIIGVKPSHRQIMKTINVLVSQINNKHLEDSWFD